MRRALLRLAGERQESLSVILREAVRQYIDRQLRPARR
jgi:predicted transcriptional regulator